MLRWLWRLDLGTLISFLPKMCPPFLYWESHWADFPMISKIPARAGALQLWREPRKEVTWLAAKSSKNNLSSNTQEEKVGEGKKLHGVCKSKGETQVETLRMGWEGWPPDEEEEDWEGNGKAEVLVWSRESSERRTHGMWGGACQGGHISTVPPAPLKPEKQDAGKGWRCLPRELLLSHSSCQKCTGPLARGTPKNANSTFFISVDISRTKGDK